MSKTKDFSELTKADKLFRDATDAFVQDVLWQIENNYETVIDMFYQHYNPLYYDRTYSTYLASSGYETLYSLQNMNPIEVGYDVGINVDSSNIKDDPYRAETDWVFNRTWRFGIHGQDRGKRWGSKSEKTFQRVKGWRLRNTYHVDLIPGTEFGLKQTHVTHRYTGNISISQSFMTNMTPSPKVLMDKWWKKFNTKKNLDSIFAQIMDSKLG
jgi:hypothetical protein